MKKIIISLVLLSLTALSLYAQEPETREYTHVGKKMPVFKVRDVSGVEFDVEAKKGKVVVVYFWATWCPYCREEMPYLESELWEKYNPTGAIFWLFANAALPRIYLVGRDGKILSQEVGFNPDRFEEWCELIDEELKKTETDTKAAKTP